MDEKEKCIRCGEADCWHAEIMQDYIDREMEKAEHLAKQVKRGEAGEEEE